MSVTAEIRCDHTIMFGQDRNLVTPAVPSLRESMQKEHRRPLARFNPMHLEAVNAAGMVLNVHGAGFY
jgi:hypothetical protein